jgi:hypothetical protein
MACRKQRSRALRRNPRIICRGRMRKPAAHRSLYQMRERPRKRRPKRNAQPKRRPKKRRAQSRRRTTHWRPMDGRLWRRRRRSRPMESCRKRTGLTRRPGARVPAIWSWWGWLTKGAMTRPMENFPQERRLCFQGKPLYRRSSLPRRKRRLGLRPPAPGPGGRRRATAPCCL